MTASAWVSVLAASLRVGDRFRRGRVEQVYEHNGRVLVRVVTQGTKLRSLRTYAPDDEVLIWRP